LKRESTGGIFMFDRLRSIMSAGTILGFFLPFVTERVDRRNILVAAIVIPAALELLQTVFGRSFDVDDLICNGVGIAAGFFVGLAVKRGGKKSRSR